MGEKGAQWLVTLARLWCTSATSVPPFSHPERYLVPIFLGFVGIFWGTPANSFADFGEFLTIFGPFLDHFGANFFFHIF